MKQYSEKDLVDTLKKVGIKKGSTILIHSAIHALGKMNSVENKYIPKKIYGAQRYNYRPGIFS